IDILRCRVNSPSKRFEEAKDIINKFYLPHPFSKRLPLSAIFRTLDQLLFPKLRSRLQYQPISPDQAKYLDAMISTKIQTFLHAPFSLAYGVLSLPTDLRGFGVPSLWRINGEVALRGVQRDLNHHLQPFRNASQMVLALWTCSFNSCRSPFEDASKPFSPRILPASLLTAHSYAKLMNLKILDTDQSYLMYGDSSLDHV
ncbi:hypothetical protein BDY24DRAFT_325877, partial [Mrakia frigida]|uniref:uncharacterized protein n=1 Tax=Mrakia frigida TaxID=29902 RepID=UPI003FCC231D